MLVNKLGLSGGIFMSIFKIKKLLSNAARTVTAVLLCLTSLAGCSLPADPSNRGEPPSNAVFEDFEQVSAPDGLSAHAAVLIEASSGRVICSKNAGKRLPMASTTKIMTALVAIESCDINTVVTVSPDAVGVEGSSIYLFAGEKLSLEDLLYAMLLESANDAAAAIAIAVGGSIDGFAEMMNAKAQKLGLTDTHFTNPHGLDDPEHYTTALELAKIASVAMKNEVFRTIVSTRKATVPQNNGEGARVLFNHNKLLGGYEGAIGIKTGYTKVSGRCLVSAAERDGLELIAVTLSAPNDWDDHKAMLDLGFSLYESRTLCDEGGFLHVMPVMSGNADCVVLENAEAVTLTLPKNAAEVKCTVELPSFIYAPVAEGERVGNLVFSIDGKIIAEVPIVASYSVDKATYKRGIFERFTSLFDR
jgi:D-alanyl-D-alanine carboxypeptidase